MGVARPGSATLRNANRWIGPLCAVVGVFGFSFKGILIKLAYEAHPVDPSTLLTLRMLYSAPLFCLMAWWSSRGQGVTPIRAIRRAAARLVRLHRVLPREPPRLHGPAVHQRVARAAGALPVSDVRGAAVRAAPAQARHARTVVALVLSYAGIALAFWHDLTFGERRRRDADRRRAGVRSARLVCALPRAGGRRHRAPRRHALHRVGDACFARVRRRPIRGDAPAHARSTFPRACTGSRS